MARSPKTIYFSKNVIVKNGCTPGSTPAVHRDWPWAESDCAIFLTKDCLPSIRAVRRQFRCLAFRLFLCIASFVSIHFRCPCP